MPRSKLIDTICGGTQLTLMMLGFFLLDVYRPMGTPWLRALGMPAEMLLGGLFLTVTVDSIQKLRHRI